MSITLPYPHGTGVGQIGEAANINSNPISGTTKGMLIDPGADGISAQANRADYAVNANVNHLLGYLNQSKAKLEKSSFTAAGGGDAEIQLTGEIFVGLSTYPAAPYPGGVPDVCFQVLDSEGNELIVDDVKIIVISLKTSIGGALAYPPLSGDEFETDPFVVFGYRDDDASITVAKNIPASVDYTVVHGIGDTVGELDIDAMVEVPIQHAQEMDARQLRTWDHSLPSAVIGSMPALVWNFVGGNSNITWASTFYVIVKGRVFKIPAGSIAGVPDSQYATFFIDEWGTPSVSVSGAKYPAIDPEQNLILAYGNTTGVAWDNQKPCARMLTSKPTFITVGQTNNHECNFEDLQKAVDFIEFLWDRVSTVGAAPDMPDDTMELPRILIVNAITIAAKVTLSCPVWLEGVDALGSTATNRHPRIEFDLDTDVIDCQNYQVTVKNLDILYIDVGADRAANVYIFKDAGVNSLFERVAVRSSGGFSSSGVISISGKRAIVRDCYFDEVSETAVGTPALYLQNTGGGNDADESIVDHCTFQGRNQANEILLSAEGVDNVTVRKCTFSATDATGIAITVGDAAGPVVSGSFTMLECDIDGLVYADCTTFISKNCNFVDPVSVIQSSDGTDESLVNFVENTFKIAVVPHALAVDMDTTGVVEADLYIKDNVFVYDGSAVGFHGIQLTRTSGRRRRFDIDGNVINLTTSAAAATVTSLNGIHAFIGDMADVGYIRNNQLRLEATSGFAAAAGNGNKGIVVSGTGSGDTKRLHILDNDIFIYGDCPVANSNYDDQFADQPCAIVVDANGGVAGNFRGKINGNKIRFNGATPRTFATGIYVQDVGYISVLDNEMRNPYRGIFLKGSATCREAVVKANRVYDFGTENTEEANTGGAGAPGEPSIWYQSPCGIVAGFTIVPGATDFGFDYVVCEGNIVRSDGTANAQHDFRQLIHIDAREAQSFHGNLAHDPDNYPQALGGDTEIRSWWCVYAAAADFVPNDGVAPTPISGLHNVSKGTNISHSPA